MLTIGDIIKKSQPSVFWCMRSLPKPKREAIYTLFTFCRHINNLIDAPMPDEEKTEMFNAWKEELDNIYDKKVPATNIGRKIYKNCMRFNLPKDLFTQILDSATLDAPHPLQAPNNETFERYVYGNSVVPILLALIIIGGLRPSTQEKLAKNMGKALFYTYILRDIKTDAQADHLYFPIEILKRANVKKYSPMAVAENKNLTAAREELAKITEKHYNRAERLLSKMNKKNMMPFNFILHIGRCYFEQMNARGWDIISPKPHIDKFHKIKLVYKTIFG